MTRQIRLALKNFAARAMPRSMRLALRHHYMVRQITAGRYARESELALVRSILRAGDQVADVGANVGIFTTEISRAAGMDGKVYSFEPVSANFEILRDVVKRGGLANVQLLRMALGEVCGTVPIVVPDMAGFEGFYWAHLAQGEESGDRELVELSTLDQFRRQYAIGDLDFVKCDVEGNEAGVVAGALELIAACHPGWLIEISRDASTRVFELMKGCGYEAFVYDGMLSQTAGYRDREFSNYLFFHPGSSMWDRIQEHLITHLGPATYAPARHAASAALDARPNSHPRN